MSQWLKKKIEWPRIGTSTPAHPLLTPCSSVNTVTAQYFYRSKKLRGKKHEKTALKQRQKDKTKKKQTFIQSHR